MNDDEYKQFLEEHLDFLKGTAEEAAGNSFYGDVPEISKQILATADKLHDQI